MTTNTSHANCSHPATKSERAKCRKRKADHRDSILDQGFALVRDYFDELEKETDEILCGLGILLGFDEIGYHEDLSAEEVVCRAEKILKDM